MVLPLSLRYRAQSQLFKARQHLRKLLQETLRDKTREERVSKRGLPTPELGQDRFLRART